MAVSGPSAEGPVPAPGLDVTDRRTSEAGPVDWATYCECHEDGRDHRIEKLEIAWEQARRAVERRNTPAEVAALLAAAEARGAAAERGRCVRIVRAWADVYPESIFPADSTSRDAISGTALRATLPRIAARLVEPDDEEPS